MAGREEAVLVEDLPCPGRSEGESGVTSSGTITTVLLRRRVDPDARQLSRWYAPRAVAWHAVRRGDADRQPRRHYATGHQSAARSVADRRRRYAADEPAA